MKRILFQGDSITDCGRSRENLDDLASGYPKIAADLLPDWQPINRGISGNRAKDLAARWQADCLDLHPDAVSILIGINDVWRRYDSNDPTSDADFEANYRKILEPLRAKNTQILLILPFLLDINETVTAMREDLVGKQAVTKKLAAEFGAELLDADALFLEAVAAGAKPSDFSADGVHPTPAGHELLGQAVARYFSSLR